MSWGSCQKSLVFKHELNKLPGNNWNMFYVQSLKAVCNPLFIRSKTWQQNKCWKLKKCFTKHSYYETSANTITVFQRKRKSKLSQKYRSWARSYKSNVNGLTDFNNFSFGPLTSIKSNTKYYLFICINTAMEL